MERIELRKCYRDYRWQKCDISNQEVKLFENRHEAFEYLDNGYGCNTQELDSDVVIDSYFGVYEPHKWIKIEEENEHYGVMSLRTDWKLGRPIKEIVAYRRDYTYLSLMNDEDKARLLKFLNGDEWHDIRLVGHTKHGSYGTEVRFRPSDRDEIGLDEWIRQNLWMVHEFSKYPPSMAASDFTFRVGKYDSATWYLIG